MLQRCLARSGCTPSPSTRSFTAELERLAQARRAYLSAPGWFGSTYGDAALRGVAYFSMEFGLGEALPLYAGGLGVLAGDYLKTASDLGVPVIGIGLLYREGYFRQTIDAAGWQHESYPSNDPGALPIRPAQTPDGRQAARFRSTCPAAPSRLQVWQAQVGRVSLYLLDCQQSAQHPADRGITARLYEAGIRDPAVAGAGSRGRRLAGRRSRRAGHRNLPFERGSCRFRRDRAGALLPSSGPDGRSGRRSGPPAPATSLPPTRRSMPVSTGFRRR